MTTGTIAITRKRIGLKRARQGGIGAAFLAMISPLLIGANSFAEGFEGRVLAAHNLERARLGIAPLAWDNRLVASAQRWADHLAASGQFEHAPTENRWAPQGENLWAGTRGYFSPEAMVDAWVREKRHFQQGSFPNNSRTGNVEDVGHYTQLVWRETGRVGCARAASASEDILVCRYLHAGNYIGERPF